MPKCAKVQFWAFGSPKAEKTRGGHNGPPPGHNVFPEAGSNRVNNGLNMLFTSALPEQKL